MVTTQVRMWSFFISLNDSMVDNNFSWETSDSVLRNPVFKVLASWYNVTSFCLL